MKEVLALVQESDAKVSERTKASIEAAAALLDRAIVRLQEVLPQFGIPAQHLLGVVYVRRANLVRDYGAPSTLNVALSLYDEARKALEALPVGEHPSFRDDLGGAWANRGIALLAIPDPRALAEAVGSFDRSIALREPLAELNEPWFTYNLIGVYINKGDASARTPGSDAQAGAIAAYDKAIDYAKTLPADAHPLFTRRVMVAHLNRGRLFLESAEPAQWTAAVAAFDYVLATSRGTGPQAPADGFILAAGALTNKAAALMRLGTPAKAKACALESLTLVQDIEDKEISGFEAGLNARHALCTALAAEIADATIAADMREACVAETTDTVESGLALSQLWEERGFDRMRSITTELFRFGLRVYETYQPHFLGEYILETVDGTAAFAKGTNRPRVLSESASSLTRAIDKLRAQGFPALNSPKIDRYVDTLRDLRSASERIAALRAEANTRPSFV